MDTFNTGIFIPDDRLFDYAASEAKLLSPTSHCRAKRAAAQLKSCCRSIERCREELERRYSSQASAPAACEWLLDNRSMLRREYLSALGAFRAGGRLRECDDGVLIVALCRALLSSNRGRTDEKRCGIFLRGFQSVCPLRLSELEKFPAALRAACIEEIWDVCRSMQSAADTTAHAESLEALFSTLRFLSTADMSTMLREVNLSSSLFDSDPGGFYPRMDEETKLSYLRCASQLADKEGLAEHVFARRLIDTARREKRHIGFYLFRSVSPVRSHLYIALIVFLTLILSVGAGIRFKSALSAFLLLLPVSTLVKSAVDFILMRLTKPRRVPRMDTSDGIPEAGRTICVISTILGASSAGRLEELRLLSRREGRNLCFGLLADLPSAKTQTTPEDEELLRNAKSAVDALNRKYGGGFYLFTRKRSFNGSEFCGRERKRGAVMALARLLCDMESELEVYGDADFLNGIRYIITLDSDTSVYPGALGELIGAALHPLCRPVLSKDSRRVVSGHAILHPALTSELQSANATDFALIFAGAGGSDAYTGTRHELYMDAFQCGGFAGKGLIDARVLVECLDGRLPDGRILSHDALEGAYLRGAYVGDLTFSDSFPTRPLSYYKRAHRWIRGDWQNLPWIFSRDLTVLDRFRLLDSLRRSLIAPMTLAAILAGFFMPGVGLRVAAWAALLSLLLDLIISLASGSTERCAPFRLRRHTRLLTGVGGSIVRCFISLWLLPFDAWVSLSAIATALWRMFVSGKNLLQWQTAAQSEKARFDLEAHIRAMWQSVLLGMLLMMFAPSVIGKTAGFLWLVSPITAFALSLSAEKSAPVSRADAQFILSSAADNWRYLERFTSPEDNFLPPDNFQEQPPAGVAHRTSPTNIGLACAAACAAAEMKIITASAASEYIGRVVSALERMPRELGHFFNWYDTRTLCPLKPAYISTVDSGNLYAGLLTAKNALQSYGQRELARRIGIILDGMDFAPLYDSRRSLFYICYDTLNRRGVGGWYDLMASEARLTSYIAVSKGDVPVRHWRALSRAQLQKDGYQGLASWSGTMFEYLMPELFLPLFRGSLLYESARFCVYAQKKHAFAGKPWGISESAFYSIDAKLNYRYKAHGCPSLALRRNQEDDMVISPYSSFLALISDARGSVRNLTELKRLGAYGRFGFIEALDFTPSRCRKADGEQVRCYMAHHVSMSVIAAANAVCSGVMQKTFMRSPSMRAHTLLLQEKLPPCALVIRRDTADVPEQSFSRGADHWSMRGGENDSDKRCTLLSNGVYNIMSTNLGSSAAHYGEFCIYRNTPRSNGLELLLNGKAVFGAKAPVMWEFSEDRVRTVFDCGDIRLTSDVSIACGDCGELRCIELRCDTRTKAELEIAFEPILSRLNDYLGHVAYWQLGLESHNESGALLVRRLSKGGGGELWLCVKCSRASTITLSERRGEFVSPPRVSAKIELELSPGDAETLRLAICVSPERREALDGAQRILSSLPYDCGGMVGAAAAHLGMPPEEVGAAMELVRPVLENPLRSAAPRRELWQFSISGDLPLICCDGRSAEASKLLRRFCLLRSCGVECELVFFSEEHGEYLQPMMQSISKTLSSVGLEALIGSRGGVYIVPKSAEKIVKSRAAVVIGEEEKSLRTLDVPYLGAPREVGSVPKHGWEEDVFEFYVNQSLPCRAWQHILTNGGFGYAAADSGIGCMWYKNAREMRINPPPDDIRDTCGSEQIYLDVSGTAVSLFAANDGFECRVRYVPGYASWEKTIGSRLVRMTAFVPAGIDARVILISGAEGLRFHWNMSLVFGSCDGSSVTCREENGIISVENPESYYEGVSLLLGASSPMKADTSFCPAAVSLTSICDRETVLVCGCCSKGEFLELCKPDTSSVLLEETLKRWRGIAERFRLRTSCASLDRYMSSWAVYQCIACRIEGRTSLYQSGGALGFRDQLQDGVNMLLISPEYAKSRILDCCAHQYLEGDVMHWWHPHPDGDRGVRTRCSDDLLWLCWALCEYTEATGDFELCFREVRYISSRRLGEHEHDRYETPQISEVSAAVIDHARSALECCIERGFGAHGLPWFGSGDWNDALSEVDGESVWLGWFFSDCAARFAKLLSDLSLKGSERYLNYAEKVGAAADGAWSGSRYLRGYFADGTPLGGEERLDSLSQSWAAMNPYADLSRAQSALNLALCKLIDREHSVVKLFDPPYSADERRVGYISGYGEGKRENGGQYTHGAIWLAVAAFRQGRADDGYEILKMLLPENHDLTRYEAEPFVLPADVSAAPSDSGRAGWTWYTGSAGWYFRAVTQEMLGLRLRRGRLYIEPNLSASLPGYRAVWTDSRGTEHLIACENGNIMVDGRAYTGEGIAY